MLEFTQHAYSSRTRILFLVFLAFFSLSTGFSDLHSNACTDEQSTRNRKLFNFRKFGNASGLEQCVDFCCRDDLCELAIFSRGFHCYGVSCDEPELCHKILDRLLMEDERQLQRSTRNTGTRDFIRHTSQVANPRCPKKFVPSFHVLLLGTSSPHEFRKLRPHSNVGSGQCSTQCCKSRDCLLSFIEDEECYGVTGAKAKTNRTNAIQEPSIGLQVAIIDRNKEVSRSLDDEDEDPDDLGSDDSDDKQEAATQTQTKQQHPSPKVQAKVHTTLTNKMSLIVNSPKNATKTNDSSISNKPSFKIGPTKGPFQSPKHRITKLHAVHPSVGENKIYSKVPTKKRIIRPDIKLLSPTKGHSSHGTTAVTQNRTTNTKSILKPADGNLSSVTKPFKTASPSKTKHRAKVTPATKGQKTSETRSGAQSISTEGYSKIKYIAQTKKTVTLRKSSSANPGTTETPKENQGSTFKSSVAKTKWHIPRFTEGFSEGSASGDEERSGEKINMGKEHRGSSGENLDFSGNDKYLGIEHNDFSGEYGDLSRDDVDLSGDDMAFVREHIGFSGDNNDLRWDDKDSSGNDKDLMDNNYNDVLSGDDKDYLEDNNVKKITHRVMQEKTYVGEDRAGQTRRKIDIVKDLDELGSDEDSDQSNNEQSKLASSKVSNLPKHVTSGVLKNSKIDDYGQMKSKRVNAQPNQQQDKERKQASNVSSRRISSPLAGKNKLKNGANLKTRPLQSGLVKHSAIVSSLGARRLKDNLNDRKGRGRKVTHDVKVNGISLNSEVSTKKSNKHLKSRKEGKIKTQDEHKRQRMIKSAVSITTHAKLSGIKNPSDRSIKPKGKNKGIETSQQLSSITESGMNKQGQIIMKYRQVTNRTKSKITGASSSRKTLKVISTSQESKTSQNAKGTVIKHTTVPSPEIKIERVKDAVRSQKHVKSKDDISKSESSLGNSNVKGDNTRKKRRKSLESEKFQDSHNLRSKERKVQRDHKKLMSGSYRTRTHKGGERKLANSNSTLEGIGDLMHYAYRKVSLKRKPSVNRDVQRYLPTEKRTTLVKTTSRKQDVTILKESHRNYKTNRTETARAKRPHLHPKVRVLQKERKIPFSNPNTSKHPTTATLNKRTHDKLLGQKSLVTTPRIHYHHSLAALFTDKPDDVSSNKNVSLLSHPTFSSTRPLIKKETNSPAGIHTSSNNELLSLKQRSNTNTSDKKASFLAHFHQADSSGSDGVEFSVKSHGKHHRSKGKHEEAIYVEDLGDADFDIMMSNDIPHKDLPRKRNGEKRDHKHTEKGEKKQRDTKDDVRRKKKRKGTSREKDEEHDINVSEKSSAESHSYHKHRDKSEEIKKSTTNKHHHHHYHHEDDVDNKDHDNQKENEKESHQHHRKHTKSTNYEHKDSDSKNRHHNTQKKHSHLVEKIENDDGDDDRNSVESIHVKHHHKKVKTDDSQDDDSENNREKEHRHHHKHKKHYDDNHWEGKIIPGKVKLMYDEESTKKRHHKHHARGDDENSETKKEHLGNKHPLKKHDTHSDSDEETNGQIKKHHRHSKEKATSNYEHEDDDYENNEEHKEYREDDEAKHHSKDRHKEGKKERAEKRNDVNYEVVKKDRHRLFHTEINADDDGESSKRKHDNSDDNNDVRDNDDDSDERQNSEEDKASADGENGNSKHSSHNRVVLGEDSESNDEDEDKHAEGRHKSQNRRGHRNEHRDNESEDAGYDVEDHDSTNHEEYHKPAFHDRHKQERHWESKHKQFEPNEESNTDDDDNDDNSNFKNSRRNFRKSFIYHRKREKQRKLRQHHENERDREEEYNKDNEDNEFHVHKQHPHDIYKHHHYRHHDGNDNEKTEKYENRFEPKEAHDEDSFGHDEGGYESNNEHNEEEMREKQSEESEKFRFRDQTKNQKPNVEFVEHNDQRFRHEKERHGGYISREDSHDERKFKEDFQDRDSPDSPHRQEQDQYKYSFRENKRPADDDEVHRAFYKKGRKYNPRHRERGHWKHRHFHEDEEQDLEGTGGSFDSSAWMRDQNSEDDHYYGGEGNQEYHRKRHHKHKHRKHRQSYEYWAYREQNPYYYDYNSRKSRPPYGYYKPQPTVHPPPRWHKYHYGGYGRWKPKPTSWYPNKEHWDRKPSWRSFEENKPPLGYQWHPFYSDRGVTNQPKPTPYPMEPSHAWPPTNPRWQQPDQSQRRFGGDTWSPGHGQGPEKQYNDWSNNRPSTPLNQGRGNYQPSAGLQPSRNLGSSIPDRQQQLQGVKPKYVPPSQPNTNGVVSQTRFRPTVRRQYQAPPPSQVSSPTNISQIKSIMDKLNTPPSALGGPQAGSTPTVNLFPAQNTANNKSGLVRRNLTSGDQVQDRNRLNGFFDEENGGKKKSEIVRPTNISHGVQTEKNSSVSANTSHHVQQPPPSITSTPAKPLHSTQAANMTTMRNTTPTETTSSHTNKPTKPVQNSSTTATPTHTTAVQQTPAGPSFGDVSQSDDSSETGKKHRKHRAPVCIAGKTTDDVTLLRGKRAGNFTNIGDVGDFEMCIKRCCQNQKCDLAFKSAETCFLVNCFSKESCQTSPSLDDIFSPRMCFVTRHLKDDEKDTPGQDNDDEWDDKVSPSGIREVCDVEKALGLLWEKTIAGRYSAHPCPRGAKGFVKRRCEADSRWLPPDFSECVSKDYQTLFDKSKKLATGADPSPLIRELSQLTTQNIDNSLIFGGDLDRATDIMAAIVQHNGQTELIDMTREDVENFVRASSNLLDMTNLQEWFNIQKNKPGSADVLRSMEMFALQAAMRLPREDMAEPLITNNIIIKMDRKSPGDGGLTFPDFSNSKISRWDARHDVIALPSSVFDRGEVSTASISFKSLPYLLPDSNVSTGLGPNSKVISTVLHPHPQEKITPPVTVVLSHIKRRRGNPKCVFWDYTLNPHRGGAWSSRGCWLAFSNHSHSICQCSHLSNFAVLMDLSSDEVSQKEQKRERTMALMWIGIPVLIVGVIGGLYMSFSWNRKSGMPSTVTRPSAALNEKTGLLGQRVVTSQIREEFPASPTRDLYRALSPGYSPTGDLEWQDEFDFEMESGDQGFKQMLLPKLQMLQKQLINEFYDGDNMETKKKKILENKIKQKSQITAESPVQSDTAESVHSQAIQLKPQISVQSSVQADVVESVHKQKVYSPKWTHHSRPFRPAESESSATEPVIPANPQTTADSSVQCEAVRPVNRQRTQTKSQIAAERPVKSQTLRIARRQMKTSSGRKLRVRFADEKPPGRNLTDEDKERFRRLQRMERRVFFQHLSRWTANSHLNLSD